MEMTKKAYTDYGYMFVTTAVEGMGTLCIKLEMYAVIRIESAIASQSTIHMDIKISIITNALAILLLYR